MTDSSIKTYGKRYLCPFRISTTMKNVFALVLITLLGGSIAFAQDGGRKIPSVDIKTLNGSSFNTGDIANEGNPIIISFWATWCSPCKRELNTIAEEYIDWQDETGVKLVAISIDDARQMHKVKPYVDGQA